MSNDTIARVHYFERQFLRTEDFSDEQAYHLAMRRRHNIGQHTWGVVHGLALATDTLGNPCVQPGFAIDGYGRELVLPILQPIPLGAFADKDSDILDVWLEYERFGGEPAQKGYIDCGGDPAESPYRWQEKPVLRLSVPDPAKTDRRTPEEVPLGDQEFGPHRAPPDEPKHDWPVFLGQVQRTRPKPDKPYVYSFDLDGRPYAGLVGESVVAPSGRARVQIGAEDQDDPHRFAVFIPDTDPAAQDEPNMGIGQNGQIDIRGETQIHGDLILKGGVVEFRAGTAIDPGDEELPAPWRIYRVRKTVTEEGRETTTQQLRIEMEADSAVPNEVVVGSWSEQEKEFVPCLRITEDCGVIVNGNLVVTGSVNETQRRTARPKGLTAKQSEVAALHSSLPGAAEPFNAFYFNYLATVHARAYLPYALTTPAYRKVILGEMKANQKILRDLLSDIKEDSELHELAIAELNPT